MSARSKSSPRLFDAGVDLELDRARRAERKGLGDERGLGGRARLERVVVCEHLFARRGQRATAQDEQQGQASTTKVLR